MRALVWFRRDLRVADNTALFRAARDASDGVIALFICTPTQWKEHDDASCKVRFWLDSLSELSSVLDKLNIPLVIENCSDYAGVPKKILSIAKKHQCDSVYFNREYEVNESERDQAVVKTCRKANLNIHQFHDRILVPPREISTKDGRFYSVFTPYKNVWFTKAREYAKSLGKPAKQPKTEIDSTPVPSKVTGYQFADQAKWIGGEGEAKKLLKKFETKISGYKLGRDIPSLESTSRLSPHLAAGTISPRQCLNVALKLNDGILDEGDEGVAIWISELVWRDFYQHVLVGFPRVSKHQPFKPKTKSIAWRDDSADFAAWKEGRTGYPIVDAGMRQLNQTGWMHNRLRMVTAMFLTKHLLIDWRMGERYFMEQLIDGDLAANNGGWQWSASTGTDSVPYFRIFNPFSQSKRFDPDGIFIKKYCPELEDAPAKSLHDAKKLTKAIEELKLDYPSYVVDYSFGRERALKTFKENSGKA